MRKRRPSAKFNEPDRAFSLLSALSNDLALPFLQIKTSVESLSAHGYSKKQLADSAELVNLSASSGLQLIEAYRLVLSASENLELDFQPVTIGSVLQEVAHDLMPYAQQYNANLQVDVQGRLTPVLAHQPSLFAAMQVLTASIIRAQTVRPGKTKPLVILGAHRGEENLISTGVFSSAQGISDRALRVARSLVGRARQPLPSLPPGSASGVLIADMICSAMWQPLRASAHNGLHGLATVVPVSKQLQFI